VEKRAFRVSGFVVVLVMAVILGLIVAVVAANVGPDEPPAWVVLL
jgi:hypothetical protein